MTSDEKRETFHAAIELIVDRIVSAARPNNAGAYAAKTRAALKAEHRDAAREIFSAYDDLGTTVDAQQLADLLEPPKPKPVQKAPCPSCGAAETSAPSVPVYEGEAWEPATEGDRERARKRLAQIRQTLRSH